MVMALSQVRNAEHFVLLLTENTLFRPFCIKELCWAVAMPDTLYGIVNQYGIIDQCGIVNQYGIIDQYGIIINMAL